MDWEKWMAQNHVKIRGHIPNDNRPDEVQTGDSVSGSKVEAEVSDNAGSTSGSHIQKSK